MMLILAIVLPPLYFLLTKKMGMALVTGAMFVLSCFLAMTVVLIPASLIMWIISAIAAIRDFKKKELVAHADVLTDKMAEKMQDQRTTPTKTS